MNDVIEGCRMTGDITLDGEDIYSRDVDPVQLRARVGMVFQSQTRFPNRSSKTWLTDRVFTGSPSKAELEEIVVKSLTRPDCSRRSRTA